MNRLRSYVVVLGLAALAITLAATLVRPNVARAAAPSTEPAPFQQSFQCTIKAGNTSICHSATFTVPAGKRLVIEYVSGFAFAYQLNMVANLQLGADFAAGTVYHTLVLGNQQQWAQWDNARAVSQQMLGFADAGTSVSVELLTSGIPSPYDAGVTCVVTGHLVPI